MDPAEIAKLLVMQDRMAADIRTLQHRVEELEKALQDRDVEFWRGAVKIVTAIALGMSAWIFARVENVLTLFGPGGPGSGPPP